MTSTSTCLAFAIGLYFAAPSGSGFCPGSGCAFADSSRGLDWGGGAHPASSRGKITASSMARMAGLRRDGASLAPRRFPVVSGNVKLAFGQVLHGVGQELGRVVDALVGADRGAPGLEAAVPELALEVAHGDALELGGPLPV